MHACTVPALLRPLSIASRTAVLRPTRPAAARLRRPVVHRRARAVPRVAAEGDAAGGNSSSQSAEASSPAVFSSTGEVLRYACTAAVGLSVRHRRFNSDGPVRTPDAHSWSFVR
jgi:hypothetical protein